MTKICPIHPKQVIIEHFDELINALDIDCNESIELFQKNNVSLCNKSERQKHWKDLNFNLEFENDLLQERNTNETNQTNETNETNETNQTNETNETNQTNETNETNQTNETNETNQTNETPNVIDHMRDIWKQTIQSFNNANVKCLEDYNNLSESKKLELRDLNCVKNLKSALFSQKFYFQVRLNQQNKRFSVFSLFTFVTDFYLSSEDIKILE